MNERPDNVGDLEHQPPLTDDLNATETTIDSLESNTSASDTSDSDAVDSDAVESDAVENDDSAPAQADAVEPVSPRRSRPALRRKVLLVAAAATIGLLAVGGGTAASLAKHVTITVDGEQRQVTTLAGSVEGALSAAGLRTGAHDVIAPAVDTQISDGSQIALERARLLTLTINGQQRDVWTTADTVEQALLQLGQDPNALALSADRSRQIPLDGLAVTADALRTVSITDAAAAPVSVSTGATTVADFLADQGITLAATDTVTPALTTPLAEGTQIAITRVAVTTLTETVAIPPVDQPVDDPALDKGTTILAVAGTPGAQQVVTQVTTVNGAETARQEISRTTVTEATPNQVHIGSKSTLDVQGSRVFFHDTEFGVNWDGLAYCESTNNPNAVNNPAGYLSTYGLFQFDLPTWASVGGAGNPGDATPEEQLVRAKLLYQSRGLEPWLCGYAASGPPAG